MNWIEIKKVLFADYPLCQYCVIENDEGDEEGVDAHHLAHAVVHRRDKPGSKNRKYTDVIINGLPCCIPCQPFSETYKGRRHAWGKLCEREGEKVVREWYDNLPLKIKESFE